MGRIIVALFLVACSGSGGEDVDNPLANPTDGPPAGNPNGTCSIPSEGAPELLTHDHSWANAMVATGHVTEEEALAAF